jgi:hypothetical protein
MSLIKQVNSSGFPLQIALYHHVEATTLKTGWKVLYEEHAWRSGEASGFIDLVLENKQREWLLNIECKRVLDTSWIFLVEKGASNSRRNVKMWATYKQDGKIRSFGWLDKAMTPESYQSKYCVVAGQDSKSKPMLERIAADVVTSTEAIAIEEENWGCYSDIRIYLNVIVTTAELKICEMDPSEINLNTGMIDEPIFYDVPYVRFRKQLSPALPEIESDREHNIIRSLISRKENTVFIVNAPNFINFLQKVDIL